MIDSHDFLWQALRFGQGAERVKEALDAGADPNTDVPAGGKPLHWAPYSGRQQSEVIKALLDAGADPNVANEIGDTPLHLAKTGDGTQALIAAGASVYAVNQRFETPLHHARDGAQAKLLIDAGADPEARNQWGNTPLDVARMAARDGQAMKQERAQILEAAIAAKRARGSAVASDPTKRHRRTRKRGPEQDGPSL